MAVFIKLVLALVACLALVLLSGADQLLAALTNLSLLNIFQLLLVSILLVAISSLKWKIFLDTAQRKLSFLKLFSLYLVGYFVNSVFPSYVGGDVVRSWYVGKEVGQAKAAASTILERYSGLVAMVVMSILGLFLAPAVPIGVVWATILCALGLIVLTFAVLSTDFLRFFENIMQRLVGERIGKLFKKIHTLQSALSDGIKTGPTRLLFVLLLSFGYHLLAVVNTLVAAAAVGWVQVDFVSLMVVLPLILLIGALPISPSGLGIQEGAFYYFLQTVGATPAQALAVAVVLRAKTIVLAVVGGVIWGCSSYRRSSR